MKQILEGGIVNVTGVAQVLHNIDAITVISEIFESSKRFKDLSFCSIEFVNFFNIIINLNLKEKNRRTLDSRIEISRLLPLLYISFREETSFSFSHFTIFFLPFPFYVPSISIYILLSHLQYTRIHIPFLTVSTRPLLFVSSLSHARFIVSNFVSARLPGTHLPSSLRFLRKLHRSPHPSGSPFSPLSAYKSALPPPFSAFPYSLSVYTARFSRPSPPSLHLALCRFSALSIIPFQCPPRRTIIFSSLPFLLLLLLLLLFLLSTDSKTSLASFIPPWAPRCVPSSCTSSAFFYRFFFSLSFDRLDNNFLELFLPQLRRIIISIVFLYFVYMAYTRLIFIFGGDRDDTCKNH